MRWMASFANSSKHPTCAPAMTVSGSPASIGMRSGAAKVNSEIRLAPCGHLGRGDAPRADT